MTTRDQQGPASRDAALLQLLTGLRGAGYSFVTPTPATHARVLARPDRAIARTTRDIFGWSLPFDRDAIPAALLSLMTDAGIVEDEGALCRSTVRVSSLGPDLYLHSAYPTESRDAVFFGPDSYRFARLITSELQTMPPPAGAHVVDMGTGSGVGVIVAAHLCSKPSLTITDINPQALRFAEINLASAGFAATAVLGSTLESIVDPIDLALANPPSWSMKVRATTAMVVDTTAAAFPFRWRGWRSLAWRRAAASFFTREAPSSTERIIWRASCKPSLRMRAVRCATRKSIRTSSGKSSRTPPTQKWNGSLPLPP
ncbi:methyltransferase [Novosphingobium panipatense]